MQKKPLTDAQMVFVIGGAIAIVSPVLYLMYSVKSIWPGLVVIAIVESYRFWKKRRSAASK